jgi:hypothetical protein
VATAVANRVQRLEDVEEAARWGNGIDKVIHVMVLYNRTMAAVGDLEIVAAGSERHGQI